MGKSGLQLSTLSFGSWITFGKQIGDSTAEELMSIAYEAGVNFFDNAEIYARGKSETVMGEILKKKTGLEVPIALVPKCILVLKMVNLIKQDFPVNTL